MSRTKNRGQKEKRQGHFIQRNWRKVALGAAAFGAAGLLVWGVATALKPTHTSMPTNQQKVERVLSIAKQRINECYDNAYKFWQTQQGTIDCNPAYRSMFVEIDSVTNIGVVDSFAEGFKRLQAYVAEQGFFLDFSILQLKDQGVPSLYIAHVSKETKEKLKLVDGEHEVTIAYIDKPVIGHFIEERLSTPERQLVTGEIRREGKVYVRTDDAAEFANVLWNFYETRNYDSEIKSRETKLQASLSSGNLMGFYENLGGILQFQEWKDLYDSVKPKKKEFVRLFVDANAEVKKYHGAMHEIDADKGYSDVEQEKRAKLQELLALLELSSDYLVQGYSVLGNAVDWLTSASNNHKNAAGDFLNCAVGAIDQNPAYFTQLTYPTSSDKRQRGLAIMQQFPSLTRDQMVKIGQACWDAFYRKN